MPITITRAGIHAPCVSVRSTTPNATYSRPRRPVVRSIRIERPKSRPYALRFMQPIVVLLLVLTAGLNAVSTAHAGDRPTRCLRLGPQEGAARALVVARPGVSILDAVERGSQYGTGP